MIKFFILNILKYFDLFYQLKMFKFLKKKGFSKFEIFFDVGAHRGETIKLFTKNFKIEKIYSFEPSKINFDYLKKNSLNFSETKKNVQIITENFAFGDKNNDIKIKHLSESSSSTINEIDTNSKYFKKNLSYYTIIKTINFIKKKIQSKKNYVIIFWIIIFPKLTF